MACLMSFNALSQTWEILYPTHKSYSLTGGDYNLNGNFIVGRSSEGSNNLENSAFAMFIGNNGDYHTADFPMKSGQGDFKSALCLDDGNVFVAGRKSSNGQSYDYDSLWIVIMNQNLEIMEEHTYALDTPYISIDRICVNKGNNGEIFVAANAKRYDQSTGYNKLDSAIFIFDNQGNIIDYEYFPLSGIYQNAKPSDITVMPGTNNYMLFGSGANPNGNESVSCFDRNLRFYSHHYVYTGITVASWLHAKLWLDNSHFLMSCMLYDAGNEEKNTYASVVKCDTTMKFYKSFVYCRMDTADYTAQYCSLVYVNDSTLIVPTFFETGGSQYVDNNVVICMIDKDLNLIGTKRLELDGGYVRILHCQKTNDGGCLIYGSCRQNNKSKVLVWKLMRDDFVIPCSIVEHPESIICRDVFPNPTNNVINFQIDEVKNDNVVILVSDLQGRKVFERKMQLSGKSIVTLDVSTLGQGVYMYQVINGNSSFEGKFIKE